MRKMKVTIPAFIDGQYEEIGGLMFKFGNCRRRAYSMKWKGVDRLEMLRRLHRSKDWSRRLLLKLTRNGRLRVLGRTSFGGYVYEE